MYHHALGVFPVFLCGLGIVTQDYVSVLASSTVEAIFHCPRHCSTVKVPLLQTRFVGILHVTVSDVGPLEAIAENKTEQKSAAKRRQRLLKAPLKPPSYDARFPTARSV